MISVKRLTHLIILGTKHLRIWTQPTQFQNLNEIFKIDFPENRMKISLLLESAWSTESVSILWKEKNAYTKKLFRFLIPEFSLSILYSPYHITPNRGISNRFIAASAMMCRFSMIKHEENIYLYHDINVINDFPSCFLMTFWLTS